MYIRHLYLTACFKTTHSVTEYRIHERLVYTWVYIPIPILHNLRFFGNKVLS